MKAIVVEDSRLARQELVQMVEKLENVSSVLQASSGKQALELIKTEEPDVIFLDIHLPGLNGFEILESLDFVPPVIFTTAFDEYAIKSFEYNAVDYLMKPIGQERLDKAFSKIKQTTASEAEQESLPVKLGADQQIFVRDGEKCWFVKISDIRLFESVGNYTRIFFEKEKPMILKSLSYLETILEDKRYFRANRQQIINVKYVADISPSFNGKLKINLSTGEEVEVSRRQSSEFKTLFSI